MPIGVWTRGGGGGGRLRGSQDANYPSPPPPQGASGQQLFWGGSWRLELRGPPPPCGLDRYGPAGGVFSGMRDNARLALADVRRRTSLGCASVMWPSGDVVAALRTWATAGAPPPPPPQFPPGQGWSPQDPVFHPTANTVTCVVPACCVGASSVLHLLGGGFTARATRHALFLGSQALTEQSMKYAKAPVDNQRP